jgi:hypothetical protein
MWHSRSVPCISQDKASSLESKRTGGRSNSALGEAMGVLISESVLVVFLPQAQAQAKQSTRQRKSASTPLSIALSTGVWYFEPNTIETPSYESTVPAVLQTVKFTSLQNPFPSKPHTHSIAPDDQPCNTVGRSTYLLVASVVAQNCTARSAGILKKARIRRVPFFLESRNWRALSLRLVAGRMGFRFLSDIRFLGVGAICAVVRFMSWLLFLVMFGWQW